MKCNQAPLHCACVVDCDLHTKLCEDGDGVLSIFAIKDRDLSMESPLALCN